MVSGKYILPMDGDFKILENAAVAVSGNIIAAIGEEHEIMNGWNAKEKIDAGKSIIMPGMVNTHTHAAMAYFRGLADDLPLKEWLEKHMWPAEARHLNPKFITASSELAILEMIKGGVTCFNDMYFFSGQTAAVCEQAGMRVRLGEAIVDFPAASYKNTEEAFGLADSIRRQYQDSELVKISVQPHSVYACSEETLVKCRELSREYALPVHIHVSETEQEVIDCRKMHHLSPIAYLDKIGLLSERTVAVHAVWINEDDRSILKERGVKISHNPSSNMKLASGTAPVPEYLDEGIIVGLGTDGVASNNTLNLFAEMRTAALLHKVNKRDAAVMKARELAAMATVEGAKALGLGGLIGSLETGKRADIITINLDKPHLSPLYDPFSHIVYCASAGDVEDAVINGKIVMRNKEVKTLDEDKILHEAGKFKIN